MRLLVSVRDAVEARRACGAADLIDCKEPREGALGALPLATLRAIVAALRAAAATPTISATIGEVATEALPARVAAVRASGVDLVKVGIDPMHRDAMHRLERLAPQAAAVVPVFLADRGWPGALVEAAARLGFAALMLDTDDKRGGSLLERADAAELRGFIAAARAAGRPAGLAGSLRLADLAALRRLEPDFAGFRSAVCRGGRGDALDPALLRELRERSLAAAPA